MLGDECWISGRRAVFSTIDLNSLNQKKNTFRYIALTLQKQYENQLRTSTSVSLVSLSSGA